MAKIFATMLLAASLAPGAGGVLTGVVAVEIHDGDTLTAYVPAGPTGFGRSVNVRVFVADAPECGQGPMANSAKLALTELVAGKELELTPKGKSFERVVYRVRAKAKGASDASYIDVAEQLIRRGAAFRDVRYDKKGAYADAEKAVRAAHVGVYGDKSLELPWLWRKKNRPQRGDKACEQ